MSKQVYTYSTASDRVDRHRGRVGDDVDTSIEFMSEEALLDAVNSIERRIINAPFSGMEIDTNRKISVQANGKGWDFMEEDFPIRFVNGVTIEEDIAKGFTGNVEISDTTDFENESGAAVIYDSYGTWDYITYQGMTNPDLATLGHVTINHSSGERLEKLYKLPDNFARAKKLKFGGYGELYEGAENPDPGFFCAYNGFLWMPQGYGLGTATLTYWRQRTPLTDIEQTLNIPDILDPVLDALLDARAFRLQGDLDSMVADSLFEAADALRGAMGYTTASSNKRIRLARPMPQSPTQAYTGTRVNRFDEANYN